MLLKQLQEEAKKTSWQTLHAKRRAWWEPLKTRQGKVTFGVYTEKKQEVETGWMEQECGGQLERHAGMNHTRGKAQIGHAGKGG